MPSANTPHTIVLAGGSGTRFWPASRRVRPKQLLPLGDTAESLLEATVRRATKHCPADNIVISTNETLAPTLRELLPQLPEHAFMAEPVARNTAACIAWATWAIHERDPKALVMVWPSDHHIGDEAAFGRVIEQALASAASGVVTTVGIEPTRGDTGFGYVELGEPREHSAYRAARFVEKPSQEVADAFVRGGQHLWNSGMFFFRADVMLAAVAEHLPHLHAGLQRIATSAPAARDQVTREVFEALASISIDHGVMEKLGDINVVPGSFGWSDIGSWAAVWDLGDHDTDGNVSDRQAVFVDAERNLVRDFSSKPRTVALVGVEDLCVVQTDDALLIVPRQRSQEVRLVVEQLQALGLQTLL